MLSSTVEARAPQHDCESRPSAQGEFHGRYGRAVRSPLDADADEDCRLDVAGAVIHHAHPGKSVDAPRRLPKGIEQESHDPISAPCGDGAVVTSRGPSRGNEAPTHVVPGDQVEAKAGLCGGMTRSDDLDASLDASPAAALGRYSHRDAEREHEEPKSALPRSCPRHAGERTRSRQSSRV